MVAGPEAFTPKSLGDFRAFAFLGEIAGDSEEVTCVGVWGEGVSVLFALEDADGLDDGVVGVGSDGVADVACGIGEAEAGEGVIEGAADGGVEACFSGPVGELLFS